MDTFYKIILSIVNKSKSALIHIFPLNFLRWLKNLLVQIIMIKDYSKAILPFSKGAFPDGINLVGQIKNNTGLGESNRLVAATIEQTGYPLNIYNYTAHTIALNNDTSWEGKLSASFPYNINIFHINPSELPLAILELGIDKWSERYNIAFWLWELEVFPDEWGKISGIFNEIWTPSEFVSRSIRKKVDIPVYTMPYHMQVPETSEKYDREYFSLPEDKMLFLCMFDSLSNMQRKNPFGAIKAFKQAFSPEQNDVGIVIKINNTLEKDFVRIQKSLKENYLKGYKNVYLIKESFTKIQVNSLICCCDVFVSLHRAEGFGLVLAEAMFLQVPTIATNWSANTEFMNEDVACMVGYEKVKLKKDIGVYKAGNYWAEPDIGHAAACMKKLYENKEYYGRVRDKAFASISKKFGKETAVGKINSRIKQIYDNNL